MIAFARRLWPLLLLAALSAATGGCNRQSPDAEREASVPDAEAATDASILTSVQAQLYADDSVRGEDIDVSVDNHVVTLSGVVSDESAERQAITIARGVAGVNRVEDELTIESRDPNRPQSAERALSRSAATTEAAWITTKIQAQYFISPDIKPWNIDVTTSSAGVVDLRGEVESARAEAEAVRLASTTEGVTRVENRLRVRGQTARGDDVNVPDLNVNDAWLTATIQAKYFLDDDVKAADIDVTTQDRVVILRGMIDSERERRQAVAIAQNTDGVRSVNDQLRLSDRAASPQADTRGTAGTQIVAGIEDPWITTKIQSKYFLDSDVKGRKIDVDTRNGVVTLTGGVASETQRELAEQIARETDGVTRVVNRLTVATEG